MTEHDWETAGVDELMTWLISPDATHFLKDRPARLLAVACCRLLRPEGMRNPVAVEQALAPNGYSGEDC